MLERRIRVPLLFLRRVGFVCSRRSHVLKYELPSHGAVALPRAFGDCSCCISMGFRMEQEKSWDFCKPIPSSVFCELGKLSVSTEKILASPAVPLLPRGFLEGQLKSCRESLTKSTKADVEENLAVKGRFLLGFLTPASFRGLLVWGPSSGEGRQNSLPG